MAAELTTEQQILSYLRSKPKHISFGNYRISGLVEQRFSPLILTVLFDCNDGKPDPVVCSGKMQLLSYDMGRSVTTWSILDGLFGGIFGCITVPFHDLLCSLMSEDAFVMIKAHGLSDEVKCIRTAYLFSELVSLKHLFKYVEDIHKTETEISICIYSFCTSIVIGAIEPFFEACKDVVKSNYLGYLCSKPDRFLGRNKFILSDAEIAKHEWFKNVLNETRILFEEMEDILEASDDDQAEHSTR